MSSAAAVEAAGLRRERKLSRIGSDEIGIVGHAVILGLAGEGVAVEDEVAGAGVEQHAAFAAVVDARYSAPPLDVGATPLVRRLRTAPCRCPMPDEAG